MIDWYIRANLKFRHLRLLVALDELRQIGRTAAYLHVTQPAVSKALLQLEAVLGHRLFERKGHGLTPTAYGQVLIRLAREVLNRMALAGEEMLDISEGRITRVSLGVLPMVAVSLVPRFIVRLEEATADVTASVREGIMSTLLPLLRAGEVDFVIGILPDRPLGIEFKTEPLYVEPTVVAVRHDHPLANHPSLDWRMLSDYPMVMPPRGTTVRYLLDHFMFENDFYSSRRNLESTSTLTNIGVLQSTESVGFLSLGLARHLEQQRSVKILPLTIPVSMRVGLIRMAERPVGAAQLLVMRLLHETAAEIAPTHKLV